MSAFESAQFTTLHYFRVASSELVSVVIMLFAFAILTMFLIQPSFQHYAHLRLYACSWLDQQESRQRSSSSTLIGAFFILKFMDSFVLCQLGLAIDWQEYCWIAQVSYRVFSAEPLALPLTSLKIVLKSYF